MAIAFLSAASTQNKSVSASTVITISPSSTDFVVVVVGFKGTTGPTSVKDNNGFSYTFVVGNNSAGNNERVELWSTPAGGSGAAATSITVTFAAALTNVCAAARYSGVLSLGNTGVNQSVLGGDSAPTVTVTTQDTNNWVATGFTNGGTATYSATAPNVVETQTGTSGGTGSSNEHSAEFDAGAFAATGSHTVSGRLSATNRWTGAALELRSAGAAPSVQPSEPETEWLPAQPLILLFDEAEASGFAAPPPPPMPSAEDDFVIYLSVWPIYEDDSTAFTPPPLPIQPSAEDDFLYALNIWIPQDIDTSGFAPLPPLVQSSAGDDFLYTLPVYSSGLSALVTLDEFVGAPVATVFGPAPLGRSVRFGFSFPAFR